MSAVARVYAIGINTFREAVRDRVLYGVLAAASAVLVFTLALAELSLDQEERVILDIGLASISLFSVVISIFLGSSLLYKEIERKTLYVILPKPIHRWEFLVGKYAGIAATASVFVALMGAIQLFVMGIQNDGSMAVMGAYLLGLFALLGAGIRFSSDRTSVLVPWSLLCIIAASAFAYTLDVDLDRVAMALILNVGEVAILAALALLFSSFSTPFLTGGFTFGVWVVGRSAHTMATMRSELLSEEIKAMLRGIAEVVPNFNLFVPGASTFAAHDAWSYVGQTLVYAAGYSAIMLLVAAYIFRRRDFL